MPNLLRIEVGRIAANSRGPSHDAIKVPILTTAFGGRRRWSFQVLALQ